MITAGVDIGGTKIEARVFGDDMETLATLRRDTPQQDYADLVDAITAQVSWIQGQHATAPIGLSLAGAFDRTTGLSYAANLPTTGRRLVDDLARRTGTEFAALNDGDAFTLSEANGGAADGAHSVVGLVIGTGIGGGHCVSGRLLDRNKGVAVEAGHLGVPGWLLKDHDLPNLTCNCGRQGCFEAYLAGPGLQHLSRHITGAALDGQALAAGVRAGDPAATEVFGVWCAIARELVMSINITLAPNIIVLGGGLSNLPDLATHLAKGPKPAVLDQLLQPRILRAAHGDTSGARGAAIFARHAQEARTAHVD